MSDVAVIGAGFSGLSAAAYLSQAGHKVHVFEKNDQAGGRARQFITDNGYKFDMGPSWYWMPDVFARFFGDFGYNIQDLLELRLLDPSFEVVFGINEKISVPAGFSQLCSLFDTIEPGSSAMLQKFMNEAEIKYRLSFDKLIFKPGLSILEYVTPEIFRSAIQVDLFTSFRNHVQKFFKHPRLISLLEFPVLFLGAMPQDTPALYSLMNFAGLKLGTWYPLGGFKSIVNRMENICLENGVEFHFNSPVDRILVENREIKGIEADNRIFRCDGLIASADYRHVEQELLNKGDRNYQNKYWDTRTLAPSCLIYYLGINKKINSLQHHTLFFDEDFDVHARSIYKDPCWPQKPQFYVSCPSRTDDTVAPPGKENIFLLMPIAPGLDDRDNIREDYLKIMINRLEKYTGEHIHEHIEFRKSYSIMDFKKDYNSFKGNAYGLANTLSQTAIMKPKIKNKRIKNLFYAGQLTIPGPGVPPAIISGKISAGLLMKHLSAIQHEAII